jgi:hypothetical protein
MSSHSKNASITPPILNNPYHQGEGGAGVYKLHEYRDSKFGFGELVAATWQSHSTDISTFNGANPERVYIPVSRGSDGVDGMYESSRTDSKDDLVE